MSHSYASLNEFKSAGFANITGDENTDMLLGWHDERAISGGFGICEREVPVEGDADISDVAVASKWPPSPLNVLWGQWLAPDNFFRVIRQ